MKKYLKAAAAALALVTAAGTFSGCGNSGTSDNVGNAGGDASSEESSIITLEENSNVGNATSELAGSVSSDMKDLKVDNKLIWLAWWEIDEQSPEVKLFKEMYGTPAGVPEGYTAKNEDDLFINLNVSYADRYNKLSSLVQSGDSPDCFPFEIENYPYSVYKNLFQNVDELFDFNDDLWADTKDVIESLKWGGHYYCPVVTVGCNSVLWYRKSIADQAGVDDPWTLFENGEWDWDSFLEVCRGFTDPDNGKYAIDGYWFQNRLIATTGTPLIGLEDGKLVGNFNNANVEKLMDMLLLFDDEAGESLRYPREVLAGWSTNPREWLAGNVLFFEDGKWSFEGTGTIGSFKRASKDWDEDEVQFVPYPKMPDSDEYYQPMKVDPIMLVASAKNIEGYKGWIYANALCSNDEAVHEAFREQFMEAYECPEYIMDRIDLMEDPDTFTAVFDFKDGIGTDIASPDAGDTPLQTLTFYPVMNGTSYTQQRNEVLPTIEKRIEDMNASIE